MPESARRKPFTVFCVQLLVKAFHDFDAARDGEVQQKAFFLSFLSNSFFMKLLLTCVLVASSPAVFSQQVINVDKSDGIPVNSFYTVNGAPVVSARFVRLTEGTPYFKDDWMKGLAISDKNLRYQNAQVKLDLFENELHYLGSNGTEMICTIPLKDITLTDTLSGTSYHFVHSAAVPALSQVKKGWYMPLAEGKASLYLSFVKTVQEYKPYNSSVAEQKIMTAEEFLLAANGTLFKLKKPKDLPDMLADKKAELEAFLKKDEMKNGSNAERLAAMVGYYNSLQ